jgi:hypothetical protein
MPTTFPLLLTRESDMPILDIVFLKVLQQHLTLRRLPRTIESLEDD